MKEQQKFRNNIEQLHYIGEVAGVRRTDECNLDDVLGILKIERSPGKEKWMGGTSVLSIKEAKRFIRKMNRSGVSSGACNLYAVTAEEDKETHELLPKEKREIIQGRKIQGRIRTDETQEELDRYQRVMGCTLPMNSPKPIEFGYIRMPGGPPKLMASAVRQLCLGILSEDSLAGAVDEVVDPSGKTQTRIIPRRPIMVFIDRDNIRSIEVALAAGFEMVKKDVYWTLHDEPRDNMYILNWGKLQEIVENETKSKETVLRQLSRWLTLTIIKND